MPMDLKTIIEANPDGTEGSRSNSYARLLGELQYLANATWPDIAFAVNRLASYMANPSLQHMGTLKRLLRYLSGTRSFSIIYSVPNIPVASFIRFADVAYANTDDQKSTSGYVFIVAGG